MKVNAKVSVINQDVVNKASAFDWKSLPDGMMRDCFVALSMALMNEWMMSSDTKAIILLGMISNLEKMGYPDEDVDKFRLIMVKLMETFHKQNSFMG